MTNYSRAGLPLEALWVDIEAMNNRFQVFTFDRDRYPAAKMRQFASKLAAAGQHWAPIFNPGISVQQGYRAYEEGSAQGVWIKDVNGNPYKGQVRPLHTDCCWAGGLLPVSTCMQHGAVCVCWGGACCGACCGEASGGVIASAIRQCHACLICCLISPACLPACRCGLVRWCTPPTLGIQQEPGSRAR